MYPGAWAGESHSDFSAVNFPSCVGRVPLRKLVLTLLRERNPKSNHYTVGAASCRPEGRRGEARAGAAGREEQCGSHLR